MRIYYSYSIVFFSNEGLYQKHLSIDVVSEERSFIRWDDEILQISFGKISLPSKIAINFFPLKVIILLTSEYVHQAWYK